MHSLIELATDNELRIRLNGEGKYFEEGHKGLRALERKIYPIWKKYLKNDDENIIEFNKRIEQLF